MLHRRVLLATCCCNGTTTAVARDPSVYLPGGEAAPRTEDGRPPRGPRGGSVGLSSQAGGGAGGGGSCEEGQARAQRLSGCPVRGWTKQAAPACAPGHCCCPSLVSPGTDKVKVASRLFACLWVVVTRGATVYHVLPRDEWDLANYKFARFFFCVQSIWLSWPSMTSLTCPSVCVSAFLSLFFWRCLVGRSFRRGRLP